jgi:hypothetical protein
VLFSNLVNHLNKKNNFRTLFEWIVEKEIELKEKKIIILFI